MCWKIITRAVVLVYKRDKSKNGERELITFRGVEFPLRWKSLIGKLGSFSLHSSSFIAKNEKIR